SPTHSLRGERDRSETKIRTTPRRLAGGGLRWPGGEVAGIGGAGWIDRERHQYRSLGVPEGHGLVPGSDGHRRRALVAHTYEGPSPISGPSSMSGPSSGSGSASMSASSASSAWS